MTIFTHILLFEISLDRSVPAEIYFCPLVAKDNSWKYNKKKCIASLHLWYQLSHYRNSRKQCCGAATFTYSGAGPNFLLAGAAFSGSIWLASKKHDLRAIYEGKCEYDPLKDVHLLFTF